MVSFHAADIVVGWIWVDGMGAMKIVIVVAVLATALALFVGLFSMARGGAFNARYGNRLMRLRVLIQGVAVVMVVIAMLLFASGY